MLRVTTVFAPFYSTDFYGGETQAAANAGASATRAFWQQLQNFLSDDMSFAVDPDVHRIEPGTGLTTQVFPVDVVPFNFTGATEALPWATQALLRLRTGSYVNGRELRGKKFIPGILETSTDSSRPSAAMIAAITGAWTQSRDEAFDAGGQLVYSRTHLTASAITAAQPWSEFAVLRSRRD